MSESVLVRQRRSAAAASGGISCPEVYRLFERVATRIGLSGKLLDFGAGTGQLTAALLRTGRFEQATAVDILSCPAPIADGVRWVRADLNEGVPELDADTFDVVCSAEVIEHLENPRFVAREWARLLKPGGVALFSTPNNESFRSLLSLLIRGHFAAFHRKYSYPAHITALLREDARRIGEEAGFTTIGLFPSEHGGIPGKPNLTWQAASLGLLRGLRFSDNILFAWRKKACPFGTTTAERGKAISGNCSGPSTFSGSLPAEAGVPRT